MRIVDTTLFYTQASGGVRTYLDNKHRVLLEQCGCVHKLVVPGARASFDDDSVQLFAPPLPLASGFRFPLQVGAWSRIIAALEPDIVEAGDPYTPAWAAQRAARLRDIPAVGFYHSDLCSLFHHRIGAFVDGATRLYVQRLYRHFDLVLAPSRLMADQLQWCGIDHVVVQPLGVDLELFHPGRRLADAHQRLGIGEQQHLLVFAGRGTREKNIPILLDALRRLGRGYHLLLIGTGVQLDTPDNVTVIEGFRPAQEVADWMASADALLHAGDQETFGLVALEAMACGLPVVGADAGALREVVPEHCGRRVPPGSGRLMAATVRDLFEHGDPHALGAAARAHVAAHHGWDTVVASLLGHYRQVLGSRDDQPLVMQPREGRS